MKRLISISLVISALLLTSGCGKRSKVSMETNALTSAYKTLMENGKTTPENDKDFIRSMAKVALELDRSIRGTKKADETRRMAEATTALGVNPKEALKLDKE